MTDLTNERATIHAKVAARQATRRTEAMTKRVKIESARGDSSEETVVRQYGVRITATPGDLLALARELDLVIEMTGETDNDVTTMLKNLRRQMPTNESSLAAGDY